MTTALCFIAWTTNSSILQASSMTIAGLGVRTETSTRIESRALRRCRDHTCTFRSTAKRRPRRTRALLFALHTHGLGLCDTPRCQCLFPADRRHGTTWSPWWRPDYHRSRAWNEAIVQHVCSCLAMGLNPIFRSDDPRRERRGRRDQRRSAAPCHRWKMLNLDRFPNFFKGSLP